MSDCKTLVIGPVPIGASLDVTVANLVKRLPVGSSSIVVYVCNPSLVGVNDAKIKGLPVSFVKPDDQHVENCCVIKYCYEGKAGSLVQGDFSFRDLDLLS